MPEEVAARPDAIPAGSNQEKHFGRQCTRVARPARFERAAPRFEAWCSIQLSYGRAPGSIPGETRSDAASRAAAAARHSLAFRKMRRNDAPSPARFNTSSARDAPASGRTPGERAGRSYGQPSLSARQESTGPAAGAAPGTAGGGPGRPPHARAAAARSSASWICSVVERMASSRRIVTRRPPTSLIPSR